MTDEQYLHLWADIERDLRGMEDEAAAQLRSVRVLRSISTWHLAHPGRIAPVSVLDLDPYVAALVAGNHHPVRERFEAWVRGARHQLAHYRSHQAITVLGMLRSGLRRGR